jgi:amino acid transporter
MEITGRSVSGIAFCTGRVCNDRRSGLFRLSYQDDAVVTVLGYVAGAAIAHNFLLASSPSETGTWGPVAAIIGLVFCVVIGFLMREKAA